MGTNMGYKYHWNTDKNEKDFEHRVIVEQKIGRKIKDGEVVHHLDHNKENNDPSNLVLLSRKDHKTIHLTKLPIELKTNEDGSTSVIISEVKCIDCGKMFIPKEYDDQRCNECQSKYIRTYDRKERTTKVCPSCNNTFICERSDNKQIFCSRECQFAHQARNVPSKEVLEKEVWETSTLQLAKKYGVSDKAVEKWCKKYGIQKPKPGYWTKKLFNKI